MSGKRDKAARQAAAVVSEAPLGPAELALYQARVQERGNALADRVAQALAATGLPVPPGSVAVDWTPGGLRYGLRLEVRVPVGTRALLGALDVPSEDQRIAEGLVEAAARDLASVVPAQLRVVADRIAGLMASKAAPGSGSERLAGGANGSGLVDGAAPLIVPGR